MGESAILGDVVEPVSDWLPGEFPRCSSIVSLAKPSTVLIIWMAFAVSGISSVNESASNSALDSDVPLRVAVRRMTS